MNFDETKNKHLSELSERQDLAYSNIINFLFRTAQTIGLIAGFGFTAISKVRHITFFILGEFLLIYSIFYMFYWLADEHTSLLKSLAKISKKLVGVQNPQAGKEAIDESISAPGEFENSIEKAKTRLNRILGFGVVGVFFILVSFLSLPHLSFLNYSCHYIINRISH